MGVSLFLELKLKTSLLSGPFYITELSFFIPRLQLDEIYGVSRKYKRFDHKKENVDFSN